MKMKKTVVFPPLLLALLVLLAGCGNWLGFMASDGSDEAKRYEITMALDSRDYAAVRDKLLSDSYGFTEEERNMNLAAAYLGLAGYDIPTLVNDMIESAGEDDASTAFLAKQSEKAVSGGLTNLSTASDYFNKVYNGATNDVSCATVKTTDLALYESLSNLQKDSCYNEGLTELVRGFSALSAAIGDVQVWMNPTGCNDSDNDGIADSGEAASCAAQWAYTNTCVSPGITAPTPLTKTFTPSGFASFDVNVLLVEVAITNAACANSDENFDANSHNFYELVYTDTSTNVKSTVITSDYCGQDFAACTAPNYASAGTNPCWPCPLMENGKPLTYSETILDTINNGGDTLAALTGTSSTGESTCDLKKSVICGDETDPGYASCVSTNCGEDCSNPACVIDEGDLSTYLSQTQGQ